MLRKRFGRSGAIGAGLGVIIFFAGYLVNILFNILHPRWLLAGLGLVCISGVIGAFAGLFFAQQPTDEFREEAQNLVALLKTFQERTGTLDDYIFKLEQIVKGALRESLIDYRELVRIEGGVRENARIWVMTSALELEEEELREVIRGNFRKGVCYTYLIPKEPLYLRRRMRQLAKQWQQDCGLSPEEADRQIECYLIPGHCVHLTIAVYDPGNTKMPPTVVIKFPTSKLFTQEKYPLCYCVDKEPPAAWQVFLQIFEELMGSAAGGVCPNVERLEIEFSDRAV